MYPINKKDVNVKRYREHLKQQVDRFRSIGKTEDEIVYWIENVLDNEMSVSNNFESVQELAGFLNLPVSKFTVFWL